MKTVMTSVLAFLLMGSLNAQEVPDTTRIKLGGSELIVISPKGSEIKIEEDGSINAEPDEEELNSIEAHWAALEFGPTLLLNSSMKSSFPNDPQWENDPGKSFSWNLNVLEHKFPIYKNYVGITTGLGFNWTQIGLRQYILNDSADSLWVVKDSVNDYKKNKLRAIYLTAPLMFEFCTSADGDEGFFLAAGVIGGVRIGSSTKSVIESNNNKIKTRDRGTMGLDAFRLDAAVKLGYQDWGVFANYSIIPLFDTDKTVGVYPLTFGLSYNF